MRGSWRCSLQAVWRFSPALLSLAILCALLAALLEGVSITMLLPLVQLLQGHGESGSWGWALRFMGHATPPAPALLLLFVLAIAMRSAVVGTREYVAARVRLGFASHLRQRLFHAMCAAQWLQVAGTRRSRLLHALSEEVTRVDQGIQSLIVSVAAVFLMLVQLGVTFWLSVKTASLLLLIMLLCLPLLRGTVRSNLTAGLLIGRAREQSMAVAADALHAFKQIKSHALERVFRDSFSSRQRALENALLHHVRKTQLFDGLRQLSALAALSLTLWLALAGFHLGLPRTAILLVIFARIAALLASLMQSGRQVLLALPACDHVLAMARELEEGSATGAATTVELRRPWQLIRFDDVGFRYRGGQPWILQHLQLAIPANSTTVLFGHSGCGKTTLIDLLAGLFLPSSGRILVDGVALQSLDPVSWRSGLAYVVQNGMLWDMSVRDNLSFGLAGVGEAEMARALRWAGADQVIALREDGLDASTGERGEQFSGGERQRLALAQALLRRPQLLLLDEPSSSLDAASVQTLRGTLAALHGQMTIVVATHDLRLASLADQLLDLTDMASRTPTAGRAEFADSAG